MLSKIIFLAVFLILVLILKKHWNLNHEGFTSESGNENENGIVEVHDVKRPFVNFYDNNG